jgi:predicted PurR-regulated permease PerM
MSKSSSKNRTPHTVSGSSSSEATATTISVAVAKPTTKDISHNENTELIDTSINDNSITFNRRALLLLLSIMGITLFFMIKMFIVPVILAICFTTLFYPLYTWFNKITRGNKILSSVGCCLTLFFGLLIPVYFLIQMIASEFIGFYSTAEPQIKELIYRSDHGPFAQLLQHPLFASLHSIKIDWQNILFSAIKSAGHLGTIILNKTSTEVFSLMLIMAIMFFTMFYLFIDGDKFLRKLQILSPLRQKYDELLFKRFLMISRATIRGTIVIGLAQGILGAVTFLIFGIKSWLLWGFVMVMFSLVPFTGAWMVMLPAAILQLIYGHNWKAAGIALMCILVVSTIDNILRPRLVGSEAKMHDLLVLFSTLGGIAVYGIMGFIIGPVIAALFIALLEMYGMEYKNLLKPAENH